MGHDAGHHHADYEHYPAAPHHAADAVAVAEPAADGAEGGGQQPLNGEAEGDEADAPTEELLELRHEDSHGEAEAGAGHPHNGGDGDDYEGVMDTPVSDNQALRAQADVEHH